ncbi:MAG TPA: type IV-A pilus assembly ATPase PilB, partial [Woeseiaceae bacterium]|nr:type IV-A pilus assembly ATPase PilB [Woeseiaceae bacterium]
GIFQVMEVTETIGRIIMDEGNAIMIAEQAQKEGVWDLRRAGLQKVINGLTGLEEINRVTVE